MGSNEKIAALIKAAREVVKARGAFPRTGNYIDALADALAAIEQQPTGGGECEYCGGCGWQEGVEAGCCGNATPTGECCGNPIPVQTQEQCSGCYGTGKAPTQPPAPQAGGVISGIVQQRANMKEALCEFALANGAKFDEVTLVEKEAHEGTKLRWEYSIQRKPIIISPEINGLEQIIRDAFTEGFVAGEDTKYEPEAWHASDAKAAIAALQPSQLPHIAKGE